MTKSRLFFIKKAHHMHVLDLFLQNTIQSFLQGIGFLWDSEDWDESQETVASLVVRDFLAQLKTNFVVVSNGEVQISSTDCKRWDQRFICSNRDLNMYAKSFEKRDVTLLIVLLCLGVVGKSIGSKLNLP
ncbi:hypothetical protein [Metabacillus niabensis]|uniref:hypothetical protein n=1 Tax=Metabacillus niabensis TaxID=324854 RepID=UPI001CFB7131|nr:hypothetical protein [Metabacillus niabensis]